MGSDWDFFNLSSELPISIHAPRVGSDVEFFSCDFWLFQFQSTLPVWGATDSARRTLYVFDISIHAPRVGSDLKYILIIPITHWISIHAPRVGSDMFDRYTARQLGISIHAPRVGSDWTLNSAGKSWSVFQSTLPVWGATFQDEAYYESIKNFNPRSPCGERRSTICTNSTGTADFNPRSPCGERRQGSCVSNWRLGFQSTLPVWGATAKAYK